MAPQAAPASNPMNWNLLSCVLMIAAAANMAWLAYNQVQVTSSVNSVQALLTSMQQEQASAHRNLLHDIQFVKDHLTQSRSADTAVITPREVNEKTDTAVIAPQETNEEARAAVTTPREAIGAGSTAMADSSSQAQVPLVAPTNPKTGQVCVDLMKVFGVDGYLGGITWEPYGACFMGLGQAFPSEDPATMKEMVKKLLLKAMSEVRGVNPEDIDPDAFYLEAVRAGSKDDGQVPLPPNALLQDPSFKAWQFKLQRVLASIMTYGTPATVLVNCPDSPSTGDFTYASLPLSHCKDVSDRELIQKMGRYPAPHAPITQIADSLFDRVCFTPPREGFDTYGEFVMSRAMTDKWKTFNAGSLDEDAVLFLVDILYEAKHVFLEQKWMGITAMQPPFDFFSITDIIWQTKPDVIIETGTANGGSALMWASILELAGLTDSRIVTMDLRAPGNPDSFGFDPTKPAEESDPTRHPLWGKYVTFIQGSTTDEGIVARVKKLTGKVLGRNTRARAPAPGVAPGGKQGPGVSGGSVEQGGRQLLEAGGRKVAGGVVDNWAQQTLPESSGAAAGVRRLVQSDGPKRPARKPRVLVLLDSHHTRDHVAAEMDIYCPMATVGSYCIVEDTRMSRWTDMDPGPLLAIHQWLPKHPEFQMDRAKELLYTTHPQGYLKRVE